MKTLIPAISLILSLPIFAGLGRPVLESTLPEGVCKLTLQKSDEIFHCSGSLISPTHVKTAGHCLEKSELLSIDCHSGESLSIVTVERFPKYNHQLIRDEKNRWFDHAIVEVREAQTPPLIPIKDKARYQNLLGNFEECLLVGYGLNEKSYKTGKIKGVSFSPQTLFYEKNLIYAKGPYEYELLPGDSGSPLLCRIEQIWYDLGTASAHDWDRNSLYAPNFRAQSWLDQIPLSQESDNGEATKPKIPFELNEIKIGDTLKLKPYSRVLKTSGEIRFNGDLDNLQFQVLKINKNQAFGKVIVNESSQFFLCDDQFMCFGEVLEGWVHFKDLMITP